MSSWVVRRALDGRRWARGLYTEQSPIEGHYNAAHNHSSPPDLQVNYGGRFWDIGFGVNTVVPNGALRGLRLSAEWLQP